MDKTNGSYNDYKPWITPEEFKLTLQSIAKQLGEDEKVRITQMNLLSKGINDLVQAQNDMAAILDSVMLSVRFLLEKSGAWDENGDPLPEYSAWVAQKIAEANDLREATQTQAQDLN